MRGLRFTFFRSGYIKFVFTPSEIVEFISKSTKFIATIYYLKKYQKWNISGRNILPQTYREKIYKQFGEKKFIVTDELIFDVIETIYVYLKRWSMEYNNFKIEKYNRYVASQDYLLLDKEDYEIFLNAEEREELIAKRKKIHMRMLRPREQTAYRTSDEIELI